MRAVVIPEPHRYPAPGGVGTRGKGYIGAIYSVHCALSGLPFGDALMGTTTATRIEVLRRRAWFGGPMRWSATVINDDESLGDGCACRHTSLDAANQCARKLGRKLGLPVEEH